ncbi:hypothetical protein [uncultured Akkermansia sp.]|nr:hypothetical protein [uncultured Akkermansia sp.]
MNSGRAVRVIGVKAAWQMGWKQVWIGQRVVQFFQTIDHPVVKIVFAR